MTSSSPPHTHSGADTRLLIRKKEGKEKALIYRTYIYVDKSLIASPCDIESKFELENGSTRASVEEPTKLNSTR